MGNCYLSENDLRIISQSVSWCNKIKIKSFVSEFFFFEKGMLARVADVYFSDTFIILSLELSDFYEHNSKLMTECYPPNNKTRALGFGKILYTAIESGNYNDNIDLFFDISAYSCPDDVLSYLSEYVSPAA